MGESVEFDSNDFEVRLTKLKDTQEGIQGLSAWCLQKKAHHKKIVSAWLNVFKNVRVEHRLTLFYLANDVIQHSKRKNYEFVESFGTGALQRATTMVRDDKVKHKISRIFKIWGERSVYNEEFLADLTGLLSMAPPKMKQKDTSIDADEFQVQSVVQHIRKCVVLQGETDRSLKSVVKTVLPNVESQMKSVKDRTKVKELQKEVDDGVKRYERYTTNLQREIKTRQALIALLKEADEFYQTQRGEVKVVAGAYKNFGNRVKALKKKLDEMTTSLPSPMPSPPANAPSPGPDNEFELPTTGFGFSNGSFIGSYMDSSLPFDPMDFTRKSPSPQSIQVINNSTSDYTAASTDNINDFFKTLVPDSYDPEASFSTDYSLSDINMSYAGVPPPSNLPSYAPITMSNYGMNRPNNNNQPPPLAPQMQQDSFNQSWQEPWNSSNTDLETPHSPPHDYDRKAPSNARTIEYVELDVPNDRAGSLDVDHRALVDVDHRNLISLTGSPSSLLRKIVDDVDFRGPPPPPPNISKPPKDGDYRSAAPPLPAGSGPTTDGDLRALFSTLPPILEPPSLGDLEKLLEGDDSASRKRNGQSGDPGVIVDMDLSDDDKDVVLIEESHDGEKEPPLPQIPGFGDYDDWNPSPTDSNSELDNNGYQQQNSAWPTPPPPMPPGQPPSYLNSSMPPRWMPPGLLPTPSIPPPLMQQQQQQRFMQQMGGGRPPFSPRNGPNNFNNNYNQSPSMGYRGRGGGRGSPYFRGGNRGGHFNNRGRGRGW